MELNQVCLRTLQFKDKPWSFENYCSLGGYSAWKDIVKIRPNPGTLLRKLSFLFKGRGGAGFQLA